MNQFTCRLPTTRILNNGLRYPMTVLSFHSYPQPSSLIPFDKAAILNKQIASYSTSVFSTRFQSFQVASSSVKVSKSQQRFVTRSFTTTISSPPFPSVSSSSSSESSTANPLSYTTSSPTGPPAPPPRLYSRHDIEDAVMGVLTRYTNKPIRELELTSKLVELETRTGHDPAYEKFFPSSSSSSSTTEPSSDIPPSSSSTTSTTTGTTTSTTSSDTTLSSDDQSDPTASRRLWDCLDTVEFMVDVEKVFNLEIPDSVADAVETPQDAVDAVYNLLLPAGKVATPKG